MSASTEEVAIPAGGKAVQGDFADWLSPMIVKELRQGLRTRTFTGLFILIQVAMMVVTFVSLSAIDAQEAVRGFFWFILSLAVGALIPLKGLQAVNREASENTLDLLVLTRLRALRIVAGKWVALVAQAFLTVVAVLPYIFIHYFLGGVNVLHELLYLSLLLFGSAVFSAITVCFSASVEKRARKGLGIVGFLIIGYFLVQGLALLMMSARGFGGPPGLTPDIDTLLQSVPVVLGYGAFLVYFFLEIGAGRLAPSACNHSTRRRLIALGMVGLLVVLVLLKVSPSEVWARFAMVTAFLAVIDVLTDLPAVMRSLLRPFHQRRVPVVSYFLAPGWHTGALSSLVFLGLFGLVLEGLSVSWMERMLFFCLASSILVMPAALVATFLSHRRKPFRDYLLVHLVSVCVAVVLGLLSSTTDESGYAIFGCFLTPHASPFLADQLGSDEEFWCSVVGGGHLVLAYLLLFWRSRPLFSEMRRLNHQIRDQRRAATTGQNLSGAGE